MDEPLRILLIEDDEVDTLAVKRGLRSSDFKVKMDAATNAQSGLEKLRGNNFDLIFLDYMLPGKDGLELLKEIREEGIETPIVIITSKGDEKVAVEMMKAGADDYISKSLLTPDGLSQSLRSALKSSQLQKDKREAQRALRQKEEQLTTVIENAPIILYVVNLEGKIVLSEGAGLKKLGLQPGNLVGRDAFELYKNYSRNGEGIRRGMQGETLTTTLQIEELFFEVTYSPLHDENGKLIGTTGVAVDISSHVEAEQKLRRAKQLAEQSAKAKEDFLANMSHEIRTPMNAIIGFAKLMLNTPLSEEQKEYLRAINSSGDTLMVIINDILDLSKIESGKLHFEETPFDPRELTQGLISIFRPRAREKGLQLTSKIPENIPRLLIGDPTRLNQVLLNLVGNALKFTEEGEVRIQVEVLYNYDHRCKLGFHVIDTGIGIPEDKQQEIFASFSQASTDTTRKFGGTGLGLTICKRLIELQGGEIMVESEEGKGSDFYFHLEFDVPEETPGQPPAVEKKDEIIPRPDLNILLVEDNLLNQVLAKKVLDSFGMNYALAQNGEEAVKMTAQGDFDLILMDVQMPVMDGYEATRQIRQTLPEPKSQIPVIALTADAVSEEVSKCEAAGMNGYSAKPFHPEILYAKIVELAPPPPESQEKASANEPTEPEKEKDSLLDLSYVQELAEGNEDFILEMMDIFLDRVPPALSKMNQHLATEKWQELYREAHGIKANYATFGVKAGRELCRQIEAAAQSQDNSGDAESLIRKLESLTQKAVRQITVRKKALQN